MGQSKSFKNKLKSLGYIFILRKSHKKKPTQSTLAAATATIAGVATATVVAAVTATNNAVAVPQSSIAVIVPIINFEVDPTYNVDSDYGGLCGLEQLAEPEVSTSAILVEPTKKEKIANASAKTTFFKNLTMDQYATYILILKNMDFEPLFSLSKPYAAQVQFLIGSS